MKSGCVRCGYKQHPSALDFHHKNKSDKELIIAYQAHTRVDKAKLKKEIAKCEILCANCHRIEHAGVA